MQASLARFNLTLGAISQEGFEAANKDHRALFFACTTHNGGKVRENKAVSKGEMLNVFVEARGSHLPDLLGHLPHSLH